MASAGAMDCSCKNPGTRITTTASSCHYDVKKNPSDAFGPMGRDR
ncbi:MAG TPA: hypothetical protein VN414_09325 [Methanosarcina sp.]|nr:hypothetical protein [Methanosarcina sp.]